MPPNILIFGTGAVGSIYATLLHRAGSTVTAVCRSNLAAVSSAGISLKSPKWGSLTTRPAHVVPSVAAAAPHGPFDFILVCTKAFPGAAPLLAPAVSPTTAIVLAQNGIDIEPEYAAAYPANALISAVVWLPTSQHAPGVVTHAFALERLELGTYPAAADAAAQARVTQLCALFAAADATAVPCADVQVQRWAKLAVNASMNPMCALAACDDANLFRSSRAAVAMVRDVQLEVGAVAVAAGYAGVVTADGIAAQMRMYEERLASAGKAPSMLIDVRTQRPMEVEVILGNLVRRAEREGVEVKLLRMLYVLAMGRNSAIVKDERWKPDDAAS